MLVDKMVRTPKEGEARIPFHQQVREQILALIGDGVLSPGTQLPPEPEFAKLLGVSRMTANKAILNLVAEGILTRSKGRGTFISPPREAAKKICALLVREDPQTVWNDHYFGPLHMTLQGQGHEDGVLLATFRLSNDLEKQFEEFAVAHFIAINPGLEHVALLNDLQARGFGGVVLGSSWDSLEIPYVDSDNILGASQAVAHLAELGHRDMLFVGSVPQDANTQDRIRGYRSACKLFGVKAHEPLLSVDASEMDQGVAERVAEALSGTSRPSAIVAGGATVALQLVGLAARLGVSIPRELALVGYDDPIYLSLSHPALTTIRQPLRDMAIRASQLAWGLVEPRSAIFDPELVLRESTTRFLPLQVNLT